MRRAVGPRGRIYAFKPQPALHAYLAATASRQGWTNVEILPYALSDRPGDASIHVPAPEGGTSPGASLESHTGGRAVPVKLETLDHALAGEPRVSFVKCDVEGHELAVFRGARRILAEHGPALLFECEARHLAAHRMEDVFAFLEALGYRGAFFTDGGLQPLERFDAAVHQRRDGERFWDRPGYVNNFLFAKP
jgi:FkbM family methyltransferase